MLAMAACRGVERGPLSASERAGLEGVIYFVSERGGHPEAFRIRPDGAAESRVASGAGDVYPYGASPDGKWLALVARSDGADQIFVAEPDGKSPRPVARADGALNWYPAFSPDGAWILFESNRHGFRELYKTQAGGGDPVRLTDNREGNFDGAWSPDGRSIAFASSRHGQLDLFAMDADGSNQRRLTQHPGDSIKPAWSPGGRAIAFISGRDGTDGLFTIPAEGGEPRNLTGAASAKEGVEAFAWHPSGRSIAFAARRANRNSKIAIVELESARSEELSSEADNDSNPAWSPDGTHLAFTVSQKGRPDLWIMQADGRRRTRLTTDPGGAWLPRWLRVHAQSLEEGTKE